MTKVYTCTAAAVALGYEGEHCQSCHEDDDVGSAPLAEVYSEFGGGDYVRVCCSVLAQIPFELPDAERAELFRKLRVVDGKPDPT